LPGTGASGTTDGASGATGATDGASGATGATGGTGGQPPGPPTSTGHVNGGTASFRITGDLRFQRTLDQMVSRAYEPPPGTLALAWTAGEGNATTFGLGGTSFEGTMTTSPTLTLSLVAQTPNGIEAFRSLNGECRVTIDTATATKVAGSFRCSDLSSPSGRIVNATGSFQAEA
jgi:hypothetical protein